MDFIKEAFQKVKQDIDFLKLSLQESNKDILFLHEEIKKIDENLEKMLKKQASQNPTDNNFNQTFQHINPTDSTQTQHINQPFSHFKDKKQVFSSGNGGVPTDRQTDRQTDRHVEKESFLSQKDENSMEKALEILNSLDSLKKEIRLKFKQITEQELAVFSAIYEFDEQIGFSDYKSLAKKLNLTESSIRDYIGRLIKKGIPIEKHKINNKSIQLNISQNLKNIVSLQMIIQLRDI